MVPVCTPKEIIISYIVLSEPGSGTTTSSLASQTRGNRDGVAAQEEINHKWDDYGTPTQVN
ncbi:MAG TPA: hypothetical protein PK024_13320 [Methanospirillum sp.]|uniref:hypothetical protein n=1 Tax=Methanospirillum sp. TaxID=45200 RepID=UPI002C0957B1|nr:hypothetical protein [Methanospirillum sp.]HOJ97806.1 hypothetical protein [Methanospirillum sp.]